MVNGAPAVTWAGGMEEIARCVAVVAVTLKELVVVPLRPLLETWSV